MWFDNFPRKAWPLALLKNVHSETSFPIAFAGHDVLRDGYNYYIGSILQEQATRAIIIIVLFTSGCNDAQNSSPCVW